MIDKLCITKSSINKIVKGFELLRILAVRGSSYHHKPV